MGGANAAGHTLSVDQIEDVEQILLRMMERVDLAKTSLVCDRARQKVKIILRTSPSAEVKKGLKAGLKLAKMVDAKRPKMDEGARKFALAALEYLNDPWDAIPDDVPEYGLLDDAYALTRALSLASSKRADSLRSAFPHKQAVPAPFSADGFLVSLPPGAGGHLASVAKERNLLNPFQRHALFSIGSRVMRGAEPTSKQSAFFGRMVQDLLQAGLLDEKCPRKNCEYCGQLRTWFLEPKQSTSESAGGY